ncbi:methyl-accepting chemotaxis protein [Limnobacter litoralis]|uniref:Histidine kinase n=1 Tax=Limnobacter litoralis TaxID=481366 RepID=A0ABQ5YLR1_9BURK|nr:methyl-accepting chemotaxis protein [Limnobacter litoralis]GLR25049.1 histidine kinase [Limnobacter litoralis]
MLNTLRAKIGFGFTVVSALGLVIGALGLGSAKTIKETGYMNEHTLQVLKDVGQIRESMINMETGERGFLITGKDEFLEPFMTGKANIEGQFQQVKQLTADNPAQTSRLDALHNEYINWLNNSLSKTIEARRSLNQQAITQEQFLEQYSALSGKPMMDKMRGIMQDIEKEESGLLDVRRKASASSYDQAIWGVGLALGLLLIVSIVATITLVRSIGNKLSLANRHISEIAKGNLSSDIQSANKDEVDLLLTEMAKAQRNLRELIEKIQKSAMELSVSASQVKESSTSMAGASSEQADATASMAAAVEELTVSISQISENSNEATATAAVAKESADQGMETLSGVVSNIQRIAESVKSSAHAVQTLEKQSTAISDIVSTITEIADRTNLLALNAAIEAARAGEQGRGFAVVADEVRKLAEQTKGSTDRISKMVFDILDITKGAVNSMDESVQMVQQGIEQADVVNSTILKIKQESDRVSEAIAAIAISMKEQSNVSVEISRNVERVAQMTEENTAAAQQNTQVAMHLTTVSESLIHSVKAFN